MERVGVRNKATSKEKGPVVGSWENGGLVLQLDFPLENRPEELVDVPEMHFTVVTAAHDSPAVLSLVRVGNGQGVCTLRAREGCHAAERVLHIHHLQHGVLRAGGVHSRSITHKHSGCFLENKVGAGVCVFVCVCVCVCVGALISFQ